MKTEFKVLSDGERETLRKVNTTPWQANQILRRCKPILKFLKGLPRTLRGAERLAKRGQAEELCYKSRVGCPHCQAAVFPGCSAFTKCATCDWRGTNPPDAEERYVRGFCTHVPFGGVTWKSVYHQDLAMVDFEPSSEAVSIRPSNVRSTTAAKRWREQLDKAIAHVAGHIEWAKGVKSGEL